jgi:hypothetical protein
MRAGGRIVKRTKGKGEAILLVVIGCEAMKVWGERESFLGRGLRASAADNKVQLCFVKAISGRLLEKDAADCGCLCLCADSSESRREQFVGRSIELS